MKLFCDALTFTVTNHQGNGPPMFAKKTSQYQSTCKVAISRFNAKSTSTIARCLMLCAAGVVLPANSVTADKLTMPFRGDGFSEAQTYYRTRGHGGYDCDSSTVGAPTCALDISAVRWDADRGRWVTTKSTPSDHPNPLANSLMWDAPIYAPVDGEIVSCWREMTDDDQDGDAIRCPGGNEVTTGRQCARRGNHVQILTTDDRLITFAHLQKGTIPEALCPYDQQFLYTDDPVTCGFYDDARVNPPIRVTKGTFLGRVGTSGAGVGAHLHLGLSQPTFTDTGLLCTGNGLPYEFAESWYQPQTSAPTVATDWIPLDGDPLPVDGETTFLLWPDPVGPRTDTTVLEAGSDPSIAMTKAGGVVAFRNEVGKLASVAFGFDGNENFILGDTEVEGAVGDVAVAKIGASSRHVVVAVENNGGRLQLIPYYVTNGDNLIRGTGTTAQSASRVAITRAPTHQGVVTAIRNGSGTLTVTDFSAVRRGTDITITKRGEAVSNAPIRRVAVDRIVAGRGRDERSGAFEGVVTAERRGDNRLAVRTWSVSEDGVVVLVDTWLSTWAGVPMQIDEVDISVVGNDSREFVVVAAREASSDGLRVQSYEVSSSGQLSYIDGYGAGTVGAIASSVAGQGDVLVGVQSATGTTIATSFAVRPNIKGSGGGTLRRTGKREAGSISDIDIGARGNMGDAVLAVVDNNGDVRLVHYLTNYHFRQ